MTKHIKTVGSAYQRGECFEAVGIKDPQAGTYARANDSCLCLHFKKIENGDARALAGRSESCGAGDVWLQWAGNRDGIAYGSVNIIEEFRRIGRVKIRGFTRRFWPAARARDSGL